MASKHCMLGAEYEHVKNNQYVKEFAKINNIDVETAITWIQSWQITTEKDFVSSAKEGPMRTYTAVTRNRQIEFNKAMKPTTQHLFSRFNDLHQQLSPQQISDAIQLIEHVCYQLYDVYSRDGRYSSMEQFFQNRELGLYDEVMSHLNQALKPDEDGDYVMSPIFFNEDDKDEDGNYYPIVISREQAELLQKALSNYDTLWQFFKIYMKTTMGVTIGQEDSPGTSIEDIDDYLKVLGKGETDEDTNFNYEESVKEAWQEVKEFIKPMKQLSKEVRRMFAHIPQYDANGKIALSTFGVPRFESPNTIHKKISGILLGVRNESQMIKWLKQQESDGQIRHILNQIDSDFTTAQALAQLEEQGVSQEELDLQQESQSAYSYHLRTALFEDFNKSGMAYAVAKIKRKGRDIWQSISFINTSSSQIGNQLWQDYRSVISAKKNIISNNETLFDAEGKMKKNSIQTAGSIALGLKVKTNVDRESSQNYAKERTEDFFNHLSIPKQRDHVIAALRALGIPYKRENIERLLKGNSQDKFLLVSNLYDVFTFIRGTGQKTRNIDENSRMIDALTVSTEGTWSANIAMSQVLRIANQDNMIAQSVFRSSGSYMNPTKGYVEYQTAQLRGFLSDMFEDIRQAKEETLAESNIMEVENRNGSRTRVFKVNYVHKYIEDHFFQDPMFVEYEPQEDRDGNPLLDADNNPVKPKYVYENGRPKIRNAWLRDLWISAETIESMKLPNTFINQFQHYQFVGSQKDTSDDKAITSNADWKTWEDFNGMQHMSLLMNAYVQSYRSNELKGVYKDEYADYPTFILGDSGKLKFIRSKRYKTDIVEKHLKEVVLQEIEFDKQQYIFNNTQLVGQGYKPIKTMSQDRLMVSYPENKIFYKIQSFPEINDMLYKKAMDENVDFSQTQEQVGQDLAIILDANLDSWIKEVMENRLETFKQKCENEGVLKPEKVKRVVNGNQIEYEIYPHLPLGKDSGYQWKIDGSTESETQNQQELDKFLKDFYYNSTLAMIEQIQITTLSPAFYPNSVEMQKRMKQIHANGKRPSLDALDRYGLPYMMRNGKYDTNMDYILINDVLGNPSQAQNEDFMESVAYTHGRYTTEFYQYRNSNPNATEEELFNKAVEIGINSSQYKTFAASSFTDGQGYRTLEGYRKIKGALGQWSSQDENDYRTILEIRKSHQLDGTEWSYEEQVEVANMLSRWQPIKPFAYGMQRIQTTTDGVGCRVSIPTQIKCSECLVIPELLPKNSRLRIITEYLEENNLDTAYYDSCIKVGAFGQAESYYENNPDNQIEVSNGQVNPNSNIWTEKAPTNIKKRLAKNETFDLLSPEQLRSNLQGKPTSINDQNAFVSPRRHKLSYSYYVEQSSVPEHTYNSRTIGTQIRKIFFDGLNQFEYDKNGNKKTISYRDYIKEKLITLPNGEKATLDSKEQLIKFYSSLHCSNVLAQFEDILAIVKNDNSLSKELQKVAKRSSNEQLQKLIMYAVNETIVDGKKQKKFPLPIFENAMEHDAAATLISIFRKASTQLQIQGGSLVQASAFGIGKIRFVKSNNKYVEDNLKVVCKGNNVLYSECEVPFAQEYTDKFGKKQKLRFEDYCNEDGSLIQVEVIKRDNDGNPIKKNDKVVTEYIPKLERDFPGSTEMICYRIPSEKDYSAVVLKVKRFTKPIEGGIIRLPLQITSITGADFDIDKMFLMRPQYVQRQDATTFDEYVKQNYKYDFVGRAWDKVYDSNYFGTNGQAIKAALKQAREDYINDNNISAEDAKDIYYNHVWDIAVEKYPDSFRGKNGMVYTNKQAFFEAAAMDINPTFKEDIKKRFKEQDQFKWHEYDYNLSVDNQVREKQQKSVKTDVVVRNNMMLQLLKARLQDPQTMRSRTTPGGFVDAEDAAKDIRYMVYADKNFIMGDSFNWNDLRELQDDPQYPDPNESLNYADPFTLVEFNKQNQIAAKLVGTFANLNSFKQMLNSVEDAQLSKNKIKMFGRQAGSLVIDEEGRNSSLYVAELLAAAVDSVKNPTLKFLNITQSTAYVAGLMAMAGFTHREIGIFLNQPIVREITKYCEQNNCGLSAAIKAITQRYYFIDNNPRPLEQSNVYEKQLTEAKLTEKLLGGDEVNSIENNKENVAFMNHQFSVLSALQHLTDTSLTLKSYVSASKMTSANSIQSSYGSLYNIIQAAEALNQTAEEDVQITLFPYSSKRGIKSPINTQLSVEDPNYMDKVLDTAFPIEQVIYDVVKKFVGATQHFFPYDNNVYRSARDFFKKANKKDPVLMPKTIDAIHKYVQNWCLQNIPDCPTLFGGATIEVGAKKYSVKSYFLSVFPNEFKKFLDANADKYPTLHKCLTVDENSRIVLNYGFNRDNDKDAFTAEWRQLINDSKKTMSDRMNVGEALYFYNYHASDFNFGSTTFDYLMPQDCLPNIVVGYLQDAINRTVAPVRYKDVLDYIQGDYMQEIDDNFKIDFLRSNFNNNELVKQIYDSEQAALFGDNDISINTAQKEQTTKFGFLELKSEKENGKIVSRTYPLAIHVNNRIYIAVTEDGKVQNTVDVNDTITYKVFSTEIQDKGYKINEENTPIEGTFLDPISWDDIQSINTDTIMYDLINGLQNNMINATLDDGIEDMRQYIQFTRDLIDDIKKGSVKIDSVQLVQQSFKAIQNTYNSYMNGNVLTTEQTELLKQLNATTILQTFVDVMCPGIDKLTGDQRADIYELVINNFVDDNNKIDISNYTIEDIKLMVTNSLLANRLEIEGRIEIIRQGDRLLQILREDKGTNPLLRSTTKNKEGNEEPTVKPKCTN